MFIWFLLVTLLDFFVVCLLLDWLFVGCNTEFSGWVFLWILCGLPTGCVFTLCFVLVFCAGWLLCTLSFVGWGVWLVLILCFLFIMIVSLWTYEFAVFLVYVFRVWLYVFEFLWSELDLGFDCVACLFVL